MKKLLGLLCVFLFCSAAPWTHVAPWQWENPFSVTATGNTYYVSFSQGNDANTSTQAKSPSTPWKTLSKINALMSAGTIVNGDAVLLKAGDTWALDTLTVSKGITIDSFGTGAQPVISGFYNVSSWTSLGNGIYESEAMPTNSAVNSVVINGTMYAMGRYPNANASNGGYLTYEKGTTSYLVDNVSRPTAVTNATWVGAMVVCRISHYVIERSTISSISTDTIKLSANFVSTPTANFGYFLENDIDALDQFGEWYYNPGTKKIDVYFGSAGPTGYTVQASAKNVLLTPTASNTSISNITFQGANTYGIWNWNGGLSGLTIDHCNFYFSGIDATSLEQRANIVFTNNNIDWSNGNGLCMANKDDGPYVTDNLINHSGTFPGMVQRSNLSSFRYGIGIVHIPSDGYTGMICQNNTILNSGGHGILFYGDTQYIYHNKVDTFCLIMDDDGGIYTANQAQTPRKNVLILENIVGNASTNSSFGTSGSPNPPVGIYLDDGTNNVNVWYNTVYNITNGYGIFLHNARKSTVRGNTKYNCNWGFAFGHGTQVSMTIDSNILVRDTFFAKTASQIGVYSSKDQSYTESFASYTIRRDSNVYCSPFSNETKAVRQNWFGHTDSTFSLTQYRASSGLESHSTVTPIAVTDPDNIIFEANTSKIVSKDYRVCTACVGLDGKTVDKKFTLAPFTSTIKIKP